MAMLTSAKLECSFFRLYDQVLFGLYYASKWFGIYAYGISGIEMIIYFN